MTDTTPTMNDSIDTALLAVSEHCRHWVEGRWDRCNEPATVIGS